MTNLQKSLVNKLYLCRTNENDPIIVAELVDFESFGANKIIPKFINQDTKQEFYFCGVVIPYSPEMFDFMRSLSNERAWDIMSEFSRFNREYASAIKGN